MLKYFLPALLLCFSVTVQANDILEGLEIPKEGVSDDDIYIIDIEDVKDLYVEYVDMENTGGSEIVLFEEPSEISKETILEILRDNVIDTDRNKLVLKSDVNHLKVLVDTSNVVNKNKRQDVSLSYVDQKRTKTNYTQLFVATGEMLASGVITLLVLNQKISQADRLTAKQPKFVWLKLGVGTYLALDGMARYGYLNINSKGEKTSPKSAVYTSGKHLYDLMTK